MVQYSQTRPHKLCGFCGTVYAEDGKPIHLTNEQWLVLDKDGLETFGCARCGEAISSEYREMVEVYHMHDQDLDR